MMLKIDLSISGIAVSRMTSEAFKSFLTRYGPSFEGDIHAQLQLIFQVITANQDASEKNQSLMYKNRHRFIRLCPSMAPWIESMAHSPNTNSLIH